MRVELFQLDPATRLVDLNKEWISTIKEFKKILSRDRGSKGDIDGKKKYQATKEFTFIYHFCDYTSKFDNYSEQDKLAQCLANAELPADLDYKKDEDLLAAITRYKTMQESPALKVLAEAKEGLHSAHRVIRKIRMSLETQLEAIDLDQLTSRESDTEEEEGKKKKVDDPITKISKALIAMMNLTNQIGPAIVNLRELEEEVKLELGDKGKLRGDKAKGEKEDAPAKSEVPIGGGMFSDLG